MHYIYAYFVSVKFTFRFVSVKFTHPFVERRVSWLSSSLIILRVPPPVLPLQSPNLHYLAKTSNEINFDPIPPQNKGGGRPEHRFYKFCMSASPAQRHDQAAHRRAAQRRIAESD